MFVGLNGCRYGKVESMFLPTQLLPFTLDDLNNNSTGVLLANDLVGFNTKQRIQILVLPHVNRLLTLPPSHSQMARSQRTQHEGR